MSFFHGQELVPFGQTVSVGGLLGSQISLIFKVIPTIPRPGSRVSLVYLFGLDTLATAEIPGFEQLFQDGSVFRICSQEGPDQAGFFLQILPCGCREVGKLAAGLFGGLFCLQQVGGLCCVFCTFLAFQFLFVSCSFSLQALAYQGYVTVHPI